MAVVKDNKLNKLEEKYTKYLGKALKHLEFSYKRCLNLPKQIDVLDEEVSEEVLEKWESFTSRFARVVDIYLTKYVKLKVKQTDPAFDGTLLDYLNQAEKMKLISDASRWLALRELRNIEAHDYTEDEFETFVSTVQTETVFVLAELAVKKIS